MSDLLNEPLSVVNVGLEGFAEQIRSSGAPVTHLEWKPPAVETEASIAQLLAVESVSGEPNRAALRAMLDARPTVIGIGRAHELIPELADGLVLHAGPPIDISKRKYRAVSNSCRRGSRAACPIRGRSPISSTNSSAACGRRWATLAMRQFRKCSATAYSSVSRQPVTVKATSSISSSRRNHQIIALRSNGLRIWNMSIMLVRLAPCAEMSAGTLLQT